MTPSEARELQKKIQEIQTLMAAYVTGSRDDEQPSRYRSLWQRVHLRLEKYGYDDPNPHNSLETFWSYCKLNQESLSTYASRRAYINEIYGDILLDLARHEEGAADPAYWQKANSSLEDELSPIRKQWLKAKNFVYARPPDYENAIKEAINSIESALKILLKEPSLTLGQLVKRADIDADIERLVSKAYGLVSNKDFVRHGGTTDQQLTEEDAVFFVSFASIVIVYLKSRLSDS